MKKTQREKWENQIGNMNPENQLELAEILVDELGLNEDALDEKDNYDKESSAKFKMMLEQYIEDCSSKKELENAAKMLEKFSILPQEEKKEIVLEIGESIVEYLNEVEITKKRNLCTINGHDFDDWEKGSRYVKGEDYYDRDSGSMRNSSYSYPIWTRNCSSCDYSEEVTQEPEEVKNLRLQQEKQVKILKLQKEFKQLEEN